jgi:hypothetical protein
MQTIPQSTSPAIRVGHVDLGQRGCCGKPEAHVAGRHGAYIGLGGYIGLVVVDPRSNNRLGGRRV